MDEANTSRALLADTGWRMFIPCGAMGDASQLGACPGKRESKTKRRRSGPCQGPWDCRTPGGRFLPEVFGVHERLVG